MDAAHLQLLSTGPGARWPRPRSGHHRQRGSTLSDMKPDLILKITLLVAAFASFVLSVTLYFQAGEDVAGRLNGVYVGIWVPSILALGAFILSGDRRKTP